MDLDTVAVATMTMVRTSGDERVITSALTRLAACGMPVAISDRGSSRRFRSRLSALPGVTIVDPQGEGLVGQVRASIRAALATGRRFVLYTEPDKHRFFERFVTDFIRRAPDQPGTAVVLAARSATGFATFPRFQRLAESAANDLCRTVIGIPTDYFYGPCLLAREVAAGISRAPRTLGWGWRPFVFATAHTAGKRIVSVVDDHKCPPDQRMEDQRAQEHRIRQFAENGRGLIAALTFSGEARNRPRRSRTAARRR